MTDFRALDEAEIEKLRYLIRSAGWSEIVRPVLLARKNILLQALVLDENERAEKVSDQKIKGRIAEIDWILTRFEQAVQQYDHNVAVDERQRQEAASR